MTLVFGATEVCGDHPCDRCHLCRTHRCCRRDVPGWKPPSPTDWDGAIYGSVGAVEDDGERLMCHICGAWFKNLGGHVYGAHGVFAAEYRGYFGLRTSQPLVARLESGRRSAAILGSPTKMARFREVQRHATPEQLSEIGRRSRRALQTQIERREKYGDGKWKPYLKYPQMPQRGEWPMSETDREISARLGIPIGSIRHQRFLLGIPSIKKRGQV